MTAKPVRLVLEAWRGAPMRQPFKIVAGGSDIAATDYALQLLVWDADGAPSDPLLTLDLDGVSPDTRIALDGSGNLQGDLYIATADLDGLPVGARPESRQPVLCRIAFLVTAPGADPAYFGLGDLRVYPKWGVDSLPGATAATGQQIALDVTTNTISFDIGATYDLAEAAATSAAEAAASLAKAVRTDIANQGLTGTQILNVLSNLGITTVALASADDDTAAAAASVPVGGLYRNGNVLQIRLA